MNVYEKEFYADVREKKIIGRGSFNKRGKGVRHVMNQALRTESYFMTAREKRNLNGKVVSFNMKKIIPISEFEQFDHEQQKTMLESWREKYDNPEIAEKMGVNRNKLYSLIDKLGVKKKSSTRSYIDKNKIYTPEEIKGYCEELVDYPTFRSFPIDIKAEVFPHYDEKYSVKELTEFWGVKSSTTYKIRSDVRKYLAKVDQAAEETPEKAIAISPETSSEPVSETAAEQIAATIDEPQQALDLEPEIKQEEPEANQEPVESNPEIDPEYKGAAFRFSNEGNSAELNHQLQRVAEIFNNTGKIYKFDISITEVGEDPRQLEAAAALEEPKESANIDIRSLFKLMGQVL